jgi:tripartite-type tricarboxylate transporter receptor subunit TctC
MTIKRAITAAIGALLLALVHGGAAAEDYPSKPVKIVVPFPAGGLSDVLARGLAQELARTWGQQVLIDNRPGANTIIGAEIVAHSPSDGYTLLLANDPTLSANQYLYRRLPYDPVKDLVPVVNLVIVASVLVAAPGFPAVTLPALIDYARTHPEKVTYGSFGLGSKTHIDTEGFAVLAGVQFTHVPYKGIAEVLPAVASGQVDIALSGVSAVLPLIKNGKVKPIAMAAPERSPVLPDVPTFSESGMPGFESRSWFGLVAPAGTPQPLIARIAADSARIARNPSFAAKFIEGVGLETFVLMPDEFAAYLQKDRETYGTRIKRIGVRLD